MKIHQLIVIALAVACDGAGGPAMDGDDPPGEGGGGHPAAMVGGANEGAAVGAGGAVAYGGAAQGGSELGGGGAGPTPQPVNIPPGQWTAIAPGSFVMGAPPSESCFTSANQDVHSVTLTHPFEITATEMTQAEYVVLLGVNPSSLEECGPECPVDTITWHMAARACNAMSDFAELPSCYRCTGEGSSVICDGGGDPYACAGYRLPSEAEWEYAYRAGSTTPTYGGELTVCGSLDPGLDTIAWFLYNSAQTTHPVATKAPNAFGLHDMAGNVWEWVHDGYETHLGDATDPFVQGSDDLHVMRGGSYNCLPGEVRAAHRSGLPSVIAGQNVGLRCARTL